MLDILTNITETSTLFQSKDLLIYEVKEAIDTLYLKLHAMKTDPGTYLLKFYSLYDKETKMFESKLKLKGSLSEFTDDNDIQTLLTKTAQYILDRFSDLNKPPLSLFSVFDFKSWPYSLPDLSTYGNTEIKTLCQEYSAILTEDEISCIPSEWQKFKIQISKQRQSHHLDVYPSLLQRKDESLKHICVLVDLLLTISPSTASCERLFSSMNLVKNPSRTRITQDNLQHQMRIVVNGEPFESYDPQPAVEHWLRSSHRHITHRKPQSAEKQYPVPSTSTSMNI